MRRNGAPESGMTYVPAEDRYDHMPYRRCGRSGLKLPGDLARPVAELRRRPADRDAARDPAPRVRPRHHPLRPGQQLRPAVRLGRDQLRAHPAPRTSRPTATSWSSRPRRATTCGPAPTASGARASTCSPASTRACSGWAWTTSTSSTRTAPTPTRRSRRRSARSTPPCAQGKALYAGISSYSAGAPRRPIAILRDLGTPLLIHQPSYSMLNRWIEDDLLDVLGARGRGLHRLLAARRRGC